MKLAPHPTSEVSVVTTTPIVAVKASTIVVSGADDTMKQYVCDNLILDMDKLVDFFRRLAATHGNFNDIKQPQGIYSWLARIFGVSGTYAEATTAMKELLNKWGK